MRIGLYIPTGDGAPLGHALRRIERAEERGFQSAWVGHLFGFDPLTLLATAGRSTRRIELGSWVVRSPPVHPLALAQQALTVQAACGNRLALGVGAGHRSSIERIYGLDSGRPAHRMGRYLEALRRGLEGGARGAGPPRSPRPPGAKPPPILLAALGPAMLRLAGRAADGIAVWPGGTRYLSDFALPRLRRAAGEAGRPIPRVACALPVVLCGESPRALDAADGLLAASARLPAYRRVLELEGVRRPAEVALAGGEAEIRRRLGRLRDLGVDDFAAVIAPIPDDPGSADRTCALLAELALEARRVEFPSIRD